MTEQTELSILRAIKAQAEKLIGGGSLVYVRGEHVARFQAYAFVVPVDVRDDLADALEDWEIWEDEQPEVTR